MTAARLALEAHSLPSGQSAASLHEMSLWTSDQPNTSDVLLCFQWMLNLAHGKGGVIHEFKMLRKREELALGFHGLSQNRSWHFWDVCGYNRKEPGRRGASAPGKSPPNHSQRKAEQATFLLHQPHWMANRWAASFRVQKSEFPLTCFVSCQVAFGVSDVARNQAARQHTLHSAISKSKMWPCGFSGFLALW